MLGIVIDENQPDYERGDFLVRPILGADPEAGTLALGERVRVGQTVRMHVRDGATRRRGPARGAARCRRRRSAPRARPGRCCSPATAAARTCSTSPDHDALALEDALGAPAGGFFCAGEIGPVGGRNFLHGFTATIAVFPREPDGCDGAARRAGRPGAGRGPRRRRRHLRGDRPGGRPRPGADRAEAARASSSGSTPPPRPSRRRAPRASSGSSPRASGATTCRPRSRPSPARRGRCWRASAPRSTCSPTSPASRP